jgi:hypothetical protein
MRSPRIAILLLSAGLLAPLSAHALYIQFCVPDCGTDTVQFIVASQGQTTQDPTTGVWTTAVPIPAFTYGPFTISATVTSQQSSTLQKISFNPTTITANVGGGCNTSSTNPCRLQIIATSDATDFPNLKDAGGYPAGVYMMGSFAGTQAVGNGDTIAMTGTASALPPPITINGATTTAATTPPPQGVNPDVINNLPASDPGNVGVSLPSTCTGNVLCKFMATSLKKGFSTQISETVQQVCSGGVTQCLTQLATQVNVELKTPGNRVSLPIEHVTTNVDLSNPQVNPTVQLGQNVAPQFGGLDVDHLSIFPNYFSLTANLTLAKGDTMDPATEEVFLAVGDGFSMTILPGGFKRLANGRMFKFTGKIDGREVVMSFSRDTDTLWKLVADVHQVQLTGVPQPPLQVPVQIGIGTDIGSDLVTARFF